MNARYVPDESGTLEFGLFFALRTTGLMYTTAKYARTHRLELIVHRVSNRTDSVSDCKINPNHITRVFFEYIELEFLRDPSGEKGIIPSDIVIMSDWAIDLLQSEDIDLGPLLEVQHNADLVLFHPQGKSANAERPMIVLPRDRDCCPSCGFGPAVCQSCGRFNFEICPRCGKEVCQFAYEHRKGKLITISTDDHIPKAVIDGSKWDGTDFFLGTSVYTITGRMLDAMISLRLAPFAVFSLPAVVDTCSQTQIKKLDRARSHLVPG